MESPLSPGETMLLGLGVILAGLGIAIAASVDQTHDFSLETAIVATVGGLVPGLVVGGMIMSVLMKRGERLTSAQGAGVSISAAAGLALILRSGPNWLVASAVAFLAAAGGCVMIVLGVIRRRQASKAKGKGA